MSTVRISGSKKHSSVNGPGVRYVLFFQGCPHHCPGCQNPETHDPLGGTERNVGDVIREILQTKYLDGLTFSGGDPLLQPQAVIEIAQAAKAAGLNIWLYTGWTFEQIQKGAAGETAKEALTLLDVLVDGPFVEKLKTGNAIWRGSDNQRLIGLHELDKARALNLLHAYLKCHPQTCFIIGGTTYEWVPKGMEDDFPARQVGNSDRYYYCHNSALLIDTVGLQLHNKSQLTPGVEAIPEWMGFLKNYSITMGIARGTLKTDSEAYTMEFDGHKAGVPICYESAFGEYVSTFCKKGADLLFVITNDGWWGHTPGYRQHFEFSKLRAIENRRCVARSANTGRSGFINQRGDVLQQTHYWVPDAIRATLKANTKVTFYAQHGDYLSRIAVYLSFVLLLMLVAKTFTDFGKTAKAKRSNQTPKRKK